MCIKQSYTYLVNAYISFSFFPVPPIALIFESYVYNNGYAILNYNFYIYCQIKKKPIHNDKLEFRKGKLSEPVGTLIFKDNKCEKGTEKRGYEIHCLKFLLRTKKVVTDMEDVWWCRLNNRDISSQHKKLDVRGE